MCSDQDMINASYVDIFNRMRRDVLELLQATYYSLSLSSRASYVASVHRSTEAVLAGWVGDRRNLVRHRWPTAQVTGDGQASQQARTALTAD